MPLDVFPYQETGARFLTPRDRGALFDEMGIGKTAQAIRALDLADARRCVIVCPAAVREVWKGEFAKFARIPRRIIKGKDIQDLNTWLRGKADVLLLSYEMAVKWARRIEGDVIDAVVFDECFPYAAIVDTEFGPKPIGDIVENRLPIRVWSDGPRGLELKSVTRYVKTYASEGLVVVRHQSGAFECTPNHKIWTTRGYVEARSLEPGDRLRVVQPPVPSFILPEILQQKVLRSVEGESPPSVPRAHANDAGIEERYAPPGLCRENAPPQFRSGISRQTRCDIQVAERPDLAGPAGRERLHNETAEDALRSPRLAGSVHGAQHPDGPGKGQVQELTARIQSGPGVSDAEVGHRSRWCESQLSEMAVPGCTERSGSCFSRVDCVEVQKQRGTDKLTVYNIEVEDNHNYFANGVLVGNCHYLKNEESARTRALLGTGCTGKDGLAAWGAQVWFLTGTPSPNDAADFWPIARFCHGTALSKKTFCNRYYKAKVGAYSLSHVPRKEMVDELKQVVASFSIRRTKKDVGLQLPPIWLTTTTVDGDTAEIRKLLREHPGMEKAVLEAVEKGGLSFLDAQHIGTLRRLVGEAKAPAFLELLKEELDNGLGKIVVFGIHRRALDHLQSGLADRGIGVVRIDGSTAEGNRAEAVRAFQGDPDVRVFLGNIRAAGTGLTLTAAADVVMFESDWSPAGNAQALMRVHRIGQERSVRARFITLAGSIDEHVSAVVARKTAAIAQIHGPLEYA